MVKLRIAASDTAEKEKHINIVRIILFRKFVSEHFPNNDAALFNNPSSDFTTGKNKSKPIHVATINRNKPVIEFLIEKGADINAKDSDGETALHWAAREGKEEVVKILLSKGADINIKNKEGLTASDTAEKEKHINIVRIILFRKFVSEHFLNNDAALFNNPNSDFTTGTFKSKPIHVATTNRNKPVIEFLIEKGADINAKDSDGETALHWAAWLGYTEVVKLLLTNKADINIKNKKGFTALGMAKRSSSAGVIKSIYEHQIRSVPNYFSEFANRFFSSDIGELCVNPSLVCTTGIRRKQPIHIAALNGNKPVIEFLIEKEADINAKDSDGCTALHWAAWAGHIKVVKILLNNNANIRAKDNYSRTALHLATYKEYKKIVEMLANRKVDIDIINAKDMYSATALHWAAWQGNKEVAELLLDSKADINARDGNKSTALYQTKYLYRKDLIELKLYNKTGIDATRHSNKRAELCQAKHLGRKEVVELLYSRGANIDNDIKDPKKRCLLQ